MWLLVFVAFAILGHVAMVKDSLDKQALIVGALIVPFAIFGASIYYRTGGKENGMMIGLTMALTALVLDAVITVPLIEIPKGGSYQSFYTYPLLWLLVMLNTVTVYSFWWVKIRQR